MDARVAFHKQHTERCLDVQTDVDTAFQRISNYKGVVGGIIVSPEGVILRTSCDVRSQARANTAEQHAQLIPQLVELARSMIRDLDPQNDLEFLRVRSHEHEIMVAPSADFVLIVIQAPSSEGS